MRMTIRDGFTRVMTISKAGYQYGYVYRYNIPNPDGITSVIPAAYVCIHHCKVSWFHLYTHGNIMNILNTKTFWILNFKFIFNTLSTYYSLSFRE